MLKGLFKISGDPNFTAAFLGDDITVLFPGSNGMSFRDKAKLGSVDLLSVEARYVSSKDETLLEAVSALQEGRPARWTQKNF